jgi:hypothetical protein
VTYYRWRQEFGGLTVNQILNSSCRAARELARRCPFTTILSRRFTHSVAF